MIIRKHLSKNNLRKQEIFIPRLNRKEKNIFNEAFAFQYPQVQICFSEWF